MLYQSKPTVIEAEHFNDEDFVRLAEFAPDKVQIRPDDGALMLLAGKDGAQGWVPVPLGHWLVKNPGNDSDIWPVDPDYFAAKYEPAPFDLATAVQQERGPS